MATPQPPKLDRAQARRLADVHRSSGWPIGDALEIALLANGLLSSSEGRLSLTPAGIQALAAHQQAKQFRHGPHEALVSALAAQQLAAGRLVWRNLSLRVNVAAELGPHKTAKWVVAKPDVFSLVNSSVPDYAHSTVFEVKVNRADLLGELRKPLKTAAYWHMAHELIWVLGCNPTGQPIAQAHEVPDGIGVWLAKPQPKNDDPETSPNPAFERLRPARFRPHHITFPHWMALTQASRVQRSEERAQQGL